LLAASIFHQNGAIMVTPTRDSDVKQSGRLQPTMESRIGLIVAISVAAGLFAAVALVAAPFIPASENVLIGVVLLGFVLGWALLMINNSLRSAPAASSATSPKPTARSA
jgi:uncharacterized membrane protein YdjX (TVP38/TMEM64 family)